MLFYTFSTQEERRNFGGSDFIELQYCRLKWGTSLRGITSACRTHWEDDSLYVPGQHMDEFLAAYSDVLGEALYPNTKSGPVYPFGPNYYPPERVSAIVDRLHERNSEDDRTLSKWLLKATEHNGFYVLGV